MDPENTSALDTLWTQMHGEKGDLVTRSENYARLTLPYICPPDGSDVTEQDKGSVAIGPRLVNNLANRVVATMFPQDRPFFTVALTPEARKQIREEIGDDDEAAFAEVVRSETSTVEQVALRKMNLTAYLPQAVEAVKHKIITGNVCLRRLPTGKRVAYGVKDYCVRRNIDGEHIEVLLRDGKKFGGLAKDIKARVHSVHPRLTDTDDVVLYTHYKLNEDGRWHMRQAVDSVVIDKRIRYKPVDLPVLPLVWTLARGDNYGRGLVEDHIVGFHNIDVCTVAMIEMIGIMADIKFLVDPSSLLDVEELNQSARGSYHQGRKDDITVPEGVKSLGIDLVANRIDAWERELSQAFLLNSTAVRDAERVTAEEVRFVAQELESAFGGLYSRLAMEWQQHEAEYVVSTLDFPVDVGGSLGAFQVVITTGLESLSRAGQLTNLRYAVADLQMLDTVPEEVRATINPQKFASFVFTNHTVRMQEFMYTPAEMQASRDAAMKQEQDLADIQANAAVRQKAGEAAVQESA